MKEVKESDWSKLSQATKTILERVDYGRSNVQLTSGQLIDIPYFKGNITDEIIKEIKKYENSIENEGYFRTETRGNILYIEFLKGAFD